MNATHDPHLRSFIDVAPDSNFPIQNLPFGVFSTSVDDAPCVGVAIGDQILDLATLERLSFFVDVPGFGGESSIFDQPSLNAFLALGQPAWTEVRRIVSDLLAAATPTLRDSTALRAEIFVPQTAARMHLPARVGDYTDFYSSRDHATNVGTMLRGADNALMPNWLHLPVAYHGRSSSLVVSGTPVRRPLGQTKSPNSDAPVFGPSKSFDFELEVGALVGPGNPLGEPVPVEGAAERIFGLVLVNDWSARDIQAWEYQPLGPFLAKNFCTSLSPWVVTLEALEPFRRPAPTQEPAPLPYLRAANDWTLDLILEAHLQTPQATTPERITRTNFSHLYWTLAQQLAHHTVNGCPLRPGDLLASGTVSGPTPESRGCMLELTWRGANPLILAGGETRASLQDGDRLTLSGWAQADGYRVGFGDVTGEVVPPLV